MIPPFTPSKRLLLLLFVLTASLLLFALMLMAFQSGEAADLDAQTEVQPTPEPQPFDVADPYICLIPDDGFFLPCHANLLADAIPIDSTTDQLISNIPCVDGLAAEYPCNEVDLLSRLPLISNFDGVEASDIWGWTDPVTGKEIVILTLVNHTAFVDISDPFDPKVLGKLPMPATAISSSWRDVKTYKNTAYIVGDSAGAFGMQIFDLSRLRGITSTTVFTVDNHYIDVGSTHNIAINEDSGLAALIGIASGAKRCGGGMHLLDLSADQLNPTFLGCVGEDGYVHDTQCVIYHGPDENYFGREICFNFNADTITIVDVTDRSNPVQLSRSLYPQTGYTHQGWVTADHGILLADDEGDEMQFGINTTTHVWDISKLTLPKQIGTFTATTEAIDHNQYINLGYSFQANYQAGLRILETAEAHVGQLEEVAYFDIFPASDSAQFNGAWSTYPYFESGVVAISGVEQGLFLVRPTGLDSYRAKLEAPVVVSITQGASIDYDVSLHTLGLSDSYTLTILSSSDPRWVVTSSQTSTFVGDPTKAEKLKISVTAPMSNSGETDVQLTIQSAQRPNNPITATTRFKIEAGAFFELVDNGKSADLSNAGGDTYAESILIKNRSGLPESYTIEVVGDPWQTLPSVSQTSLVDGDEDYELLLFMDVEMGLESSFVLTVTPSSDLDAFQTLTGTITASADADLFVVETKSLQAITYTVYLTNSGDLVDRFNLSIEEGGWAATPSLTQTEPISAGQSTVFEVVIIVGDGTHSQSQLRLHSLRSGQEVANIALAPQLYRVNFPIVLSNSTIR